MRYVLKNVGRALRNAASFLLFPFLFLLLWATERTAKTIGRGVLLDLSIRAWERAGDLTSKTRVDTVVLVSSFVMATWFVTLLDPTYLYRYPALIPLRDSYGGRAFWLPVTGLVSAAQFITAFAYGMRGMNVRRWEVACIVTTGIVAGIYICQATLLSMSGANLVSNLSYGMFGINFYYAVKHGVIRAVDKSKAAIRKEIALSREQAGLSGPPRLVITSRPVAPPAP